MASPLLGSGSGIPVSPRSSQFSSRASFEEKLQVCRTTAAQLATRGKGILAADEGPEHWPSRFAAIGIKENTLENRKAWRQVLFGNAKDSEEYPFDKYISGVILHEETFPQVSDEDGVSFVDLIRSRGVLVGITVDKPAAVIPTTGEPITQGSQDLASRCAYYFARGARFAKWRAVLQTTIPESNPAVPHRPYTGARPSQIAIEENTQALARYAATAQAAGLCPIVEPELLMDGTHDFARSEEITRTILAATFKALHDHRVDLEGIILKPSWVIPGTGYTKAFGHEHPVSAEDVARATLSVLRDTVPPSVPGVMFLSGGQTEDQALAHLVSINHLARNTKTPTPWLLSFSYGRAIQDGARKVWLGKVENTRAARETFIARAKKLSEASSVESLSPSPSSGLRSSGGQHPHHANN